MNYIIWICWGGLLLTGCTQDTETSQKKDQADIAPHHSVRENVITQHQRVVQDLEEKNIQKKKKNESER